MKKLLQVIHGLCYQSELSDQETKSIQRRKKVYLQFLLSILLSISFSGKAQEILWAKKMIVPSPSVFQRSFLNDNKENIYILYSGELDYYYWDEAYDTSGTYLIKYDKDGNFIFSKHWSGSIFIKNIIYDGSGYFYFTGYFRDTTNFSTHILENHGKTDCIVGKLNENAEVQWIKSFGSQDSDYSNSITINETTQEILITGSITKGIIQYEDSTLIMPDSSIMIASFDSEGNLIMMNGYSFFTTAEKYHNNNGIEIKTNEYGDIFLLADHTGNHPFDQPLPMGRYLFKLDKDYNMIWKKYINGSSCYYGWSCGNLEINNDNNPLLSSYCSGKYGGNGSALTYDKGTGNSIGTYTIPESYYSDIDITCNGIYLTGTESANGCPCPSNHPGYQVVKKLNSKNDVVWEKKIFNAYINKVSSDDHGNIYINGSFNNGLIFGNDTLMGHGYYDNLFFAKLREQEIATLNLSSKSICFNSSPIELSGGLPSGGSYSGKGVISGKFSAFIAGIGEHSITYTYSDSSGCSTSDLQTIKVENCTNLNNQLITSHQLINIYPNPSNGSFRFQASDVSISGLKVFDTMGQLVYNHPTIQSSNFQIDLSSKAKGIYFVEIAGNGFKEVRKIVLQ